MSDRTYAKKVVATPPLPSARSRSHWSASPAQTSRAEPPDYDAWQERSERLGHHFDRIRIAADRQHEAPESRQDPPSAGTAPIQGNFLETARRKWLPTWLGGYTPSQVRKMEQREATVRSIKESRVEKTGLERLEDIRHGLKSNPNLSSRDKLLLQTMNEVVPSAITGGNVEVQDVSKQSKEGQTTWKKSGGYKVELQPEDEIEDPDRYLSTLFHELTHVKVDQTYRTNLQTGKVFQNLPQFKNQGAENAEKKSLSDRAEGLIDVLDTDTDIPKEVKSYIQKQLTYTAIKPQDETDTVLNEMLLYLRNKKIPETSSTSRGIEKWAKERYELRQTERNPTLKTKKKKK